MERGQPLLHNYPKSRKIVLLLMVSGKESMTPADLKLLIEHLRTQPRETEWLEFKHNKVEPREIGKYLSALANAAALHQQPRAYLVWGIENQTHNVLGTEFNPRETKVGSEDIESWLLRSLSPRLDFRIYEATIDGKKIVLFDIPPASHQPVGFEGVRYIRIGSYKKPFKDFPDKEKELWNILSDRSFETDFAAVSVSPDDVLLKIDHAGALRLLGIPAPESKQAILDRLVTEKIIIANSAGAFDITNVGAILFAADLRNFERLARKAPRVVIYHGNSRTQTIKEHVEYRGYAIGFSSLLAYVNDQLPHNEQIGQAFRQQVRLYPEIAIRELVPNALIHQDFSLLGTGPMIELFTDRMEITNPGLPLIETSRFIDGPAQSRNEKLARFMRRMNICEERGSGIDKVIEAVEAYQLPPPDFRKTSQHTLVVLFGPRSFGAMNREERIRACYQHACLSHVSGRQFTNASLRKRLGIADKNYPMVSRVIRDAINEKLIRSVAGIGKEHGYVPAWA